MSTGARITIAIATSLSAVGFVIIGVLLGPTLPAGSLPFYGLAAFCALIAVACLSRRSHPVTLRIVGLIIFATYLICVYDSIGDKDIVKPVAGLVVWGLPGGYLAIAGKYPAWGRASAAFGSVGDRER